MEDHGKEERIVRQMCDALCAALGQSSAETLRPFFTEDVVYHNMPMDPAIGIEATIAFIEGFLAMFDGFTIDTRHLAVADNVVLTERVDTLTKGKAVVALPVMGAFEIRDDKISVWRDYFDMAKVTDVLSESD